MWEGAGVDGLSLLPVEDDGPSPWVSRYVEQVAVAAAGQGLALVDFGRWDLGDPVMARTSVPRLCRYPECECDRDYACGSTS